MISPRNSIKLAATKLKVKRGLTDLLLSSIVYCLQH